MRALKTNVGKGFMVVFCQSRKLECFKHALVNRFVGVARPAHFRARSFAQLRGFAQCALVERSFPSAFSFPVVSSICVFVHAD